MAMTPRQQAALGLYDARPMTLEDETPGWTKALGPIGSVIGALAGIPGGPPGMAAGAALGGSIGGAAGGLAEGNTEEFMSRAGQGARQYAAMEEAQKRRALDHRMKKRLEALGIQK